MGTWHPAVVTFHVRHFSRVGLGGGRGARVYLEQARMGAKKLSPCGTEGASGDVVPVVVAIASEGWPGVGHASSAGRLYLARAGPGT